MSIPYFSKNPYNQDERYCRQCHSTAFCTDVAQGDIICTNCGVVAQSHIPHLGPEWRDFDAPDDLAKGAASSARCGTVPVNESKYIGGLEPTTMTNSIYGEHYGHGSAELAAKEAKVRRSLIKTHRVVEAFIEKRWKKNLEDRKLDRIVDSDVRPDARGEEKMEREEESRFISEKWSVDRALLLHGTPDELPSQEDVKNQREYLSKKMDASQRKTSLDVYHAYKLVKGALQRLHLIDNTQVFTEIIEMVCRYASTKKSFSVRGVSTRVAKMDKKLAEQQKEWNKRRQMGAIGSAFIYLICKRNGLGRSLIEICNSFRVTDANIPFLVNKENLVKATHFSKAIKEVKLLFPDYVQSATLRASSHLLAETPTSASIQLESKGAQGNVLNLSEATSTANLIEHMMKKLNLSPTALTGITTIVLHCKQEAFDLGIGTKQIALIASVAVLVCDAGVIMQRLATKMIEPGNSVLGKGKHMRPNKKRKRIEVNKPPNSSQPSISTSDGKIVKEEPINSLCESVSKKSIKSDLFSYSPIPLINNDRAYWYEWTNEKPWDRGLKQIEASCNISGSSVQEFYKKKLYPRRKDLLELLQGSLIQENARVNKKLGCKVHMLFHNIAAAAPLMTVRF